MRQEAVLLNFKVIFQTLAVRRFHFKFYESWISKHWRIIVKILIPKGREGTQKYKLNRQKDFTKA